MKTLFFFILFIFIGIFYQTEMTAQTAKSYINIYETLVPQIDPTAQLLSIKGDSILLNGTSKVWMNQYRSTQNDTVIDHFFYVTATGFPPIITLIDTSFNNWISDSVETISKPWIDSDSALIIAEKQGGKEFRNMNPRYKIEMILEQPLASTPSPRWYVYYNSLDNPDSVLFVNIDATDSIVSVIRSSNKIQPDKFILYQNYPNPFNPTTKISYSIPQTSFVTLKIYDILGKEVSTLVDELKSPGNYEINFNANNLSSGIYFYQMKTKNYVQTKKMLLLQ